MTIDIKKAQAAALNAGNAGDLRALVSIAGHIARLARLGVPVPSTVRWLWDPEPIVGGERNPPLALSGPNLLELWHDEEKHPEVEKWLARALGRMYQGDWGYTAKGDKGANERSLSDGSRLLGVFPWYGEPEGNRDLWIFVEAAHDEDVRYRRVSALHRSDY